MTGVGKTPVNGHFTVELSLHLLPPLKGMTHLPLFIFMDGMRDDLRQVVRGIGVEVHSGLGRNGHTGPVGIERKSVGQQMARSACEDHDFLRGP